METAKLNERFVEGFVAVVKSAGIEDPDATAQLLKISSRRALEQLKPDQYRAGFESITKQAGKLGHFAKGFEGVTKQAQLGGVIRTGLRRGLPLLGAAGIGRATVASPGSSDDSPEFAEALQQEQWRKYQQKGTTGKWLARSFGGYGDAVNKATDYALSMKNPGKLQEERLKQIAALEYKLKQLKKMPTPDVTSTPAATPVATGIPRRWTPYSTYGYGGPSGWWYRYGNPPPNQTAAQ